MRSWVFHPLIFYPLAALLAALVVALSLQPQAWPREAAPVASAEADGLALWGDALGAPANDPSQHINVVRDFFGRTHALRIAQMPDQAPPQPDYDGVRLLLSPETAATLEGRAATVEVSYRPLPVNAAASLAMSIRGGAPSPWVEHAAPPQPATLRFELPATTGVTALGLRALSPQNDQAYGIEITRIRITPR
jgi:hypothetical protein